MSEERTNEDLYIEQIETLHSLVREAIALEKLIATKLLGRQRLREQRQTSLEFLKGETLYGIIQRRLLAQDLSLIEATDTLRLACGGFDQFRCRIQNLLGSLSKQQEMKPARDRLDPRALIHSVVEMLGGAAEEKGIRFIFGHDEDGVVIGDRDLLFRALFNIVDNAIKYSHPRAELAEKRFITVESRRHTVRGDWVFGVQSYGVGIDEDEIQNGHVFEYGNRGRRSGDGGRSGNGIGLAETRRIVNAHGGEIKIESKARELAFLTTVRVIVPA